MAKVNHKALPPFTVSALGDKPVFAATGAIATAALLVVATRKEEAQASSAWSGNVRASRSTARRGAPHARPRGGACAWGTELRRGARARTCAPRR
eukprot:4835896-Pleurochrysis_carterae.AAC.1